MTRRRIAVLLPVAGLLAATITACTASSTLGARTAAPGSASPRSSTSVSPTPRLTPAAQRWGLAPGEPGPKLQYQPDVVRVGGGPEAVEGVSADGLTFTIDGRAAHAGELQPGRILYASGRVVGRVLALREVAGNKAVTLGPVSLTELYRKLDFKIEQPVSIASVGRQPYPTQAATLGPTPEPSHSARSGSRSKLPPRFVTHPIELAADPSPFSVSTECCSSGVGINAGYYAGGTAINLKAKLYLNAPKITAFVKIGEGGKPLQAALQLSGVGGLRLGFTASAAAGANAHAPVVEVPVDLSLPLYALGVPAAFNFVQRFSLKTAFSARNSSLSAAGDYGFGGSTGFYYDGAFHVQVPHGFSVRSSLLDSVQGISVGIESLVFSYTARAYVGVGPIGFTTGVYFGLTATITVLHQSDVVLGACRQTSFEMSAIVGIGWTIPGLLASIVNAILRVFKVKPIPSYGGTAPLTKTVVPQRVADTPAGCAGGR
jgi:hypothetical protein